MDPRYWAFNIFIFLVVFGFLLQLVGIVNGPLNISNLNELQGTVTFAVCPPQISLPGTNITTGGCLFEVKAPRFPITVLQGFLMTLASMLAVYYGSNIIIGLVRGASPFSMGFDIMLMLKIVAIAFIYTVISPVFEIFKVFYALGMIGKILGIFIGLLYFFSAFALLYTYTQ